LSVPPWWRWWQGAQRKSSAGGSSSTNAHRPTKLVRIDGASVPLATRSLPPAPPDRIPPAAQPRLASDEVWSTLTDRREAGSEPVCSEAHALRDVRAAKEEGRSPAAVRDFDVGQAPQTPLVAA